jgi:hypothetical protein
MAEAATSAATTGSAKTTINLDLAVMESPGREP